MKNIKFEIKKGTDKGRNKHDCQNTDLVLFGLSNRKRQALVFQCAKCGAQFYYSTIVKKLFNSLTVMEMWENAEIAQRQAVKAMQSMAKPKSYIYK